MADAQAGDRVPDRRRVWLVRSTLTAIGAGTSLAVARLLAMPEAYWAAVTTIIVMQSTLGAAWTVSKQRLIGTLVGAAVGGVAATFVEPGVVAFGVEVFALGLLCGALGLERNAYRFAGVTLGTVTLVTRGAAPFMIATHRFVEVSLGILVGLVLPAVWPAPELADDA